MAWVSPKTFITGAILTAADLNSNVRDLLNYLKSVVDGTGTDKIPSAALNLTGTASLETYNTTALASTTGTTVEVGRFRGNDQGNLNTLRVLLRRIGTGTGWATTAWRLMQDIDSGTADPSYIEIGNSYVVLGAGAKAVRFDTTGLLDFAGDTFYTIGPANNGTQVKGWDNVTLVTNNGGAGKYVQMLSTGQLTGSAFFDSGEVSIAASTIGTVSPNFTPGGALIGPRFVWGLWGTGSGGENRPISSSFGATGTVRFGSMTTNTINVDNQTGATVYVRVWAMY